MSRVVLQVQALRPQQTCALQQQRLLPQPQALHAVLGARAQRSVPVMLTALLQALPSTSLRAALTARRAPAAVMTQTTQLLLAVVMKKVFLRLPLRILPLQQSVGELRS